jgi:hypothetical protein
MPLSFSILGANLLEDPRSLAHSLTTSCSISFTRGTRVSLQATERRHFFDLFRLVSA